MFGRFGTKLQTALGHNWDIRSKPEVNTGKLKDIMPILFGRGNGTINKFHHVFDLEGPVQKLLCMVHFSRVPVKINNRRTNVCMVV